MRLSDLVGPQHGVPESWSDVEIKGLTADSRDVQTGYLFAALSGSRTDGAKFIQAAIEHGAAAVMLAAGAANAAKSLPVPVIEEDDPRRALALMAARFFGAQPAVAAAVTGTNGKTSVVAFLQQIWRGLGLEAASLGTVGLVTPKNVQALDHTTPDPVRLHGLLAEIAAQGVSHIAVEASSHGLQQRRLDGLVLSAAGFTNISRDHLDYHADFDDYLAQKLRLFDELLPADGSAVINADGHHAADFRAAAEAREVRVLTVGRKGKDLALVSDEIDGLTQRLRVRAKGREVDVKLPLVGAFQASNALVAAGLAVACGAAPADVLPLLAKLKGARGRLELAGTTTEGAPVYIDYAHTPDALANALDALRPYARGRLIVAFGCGGDRDKGKRPLMGAVAGDRADAVFVTDDNPRGEDAAAIRNDIVKSVPEANEIGDRAEAIAAAIGAAGDGDVVLIAGKGHETGQIVGDDIIPFSDHDAVAAALGEVTING